MWQYFGALNTKVPTAGLPKLSPDSGIAERCGGTTDKSPASLTPLRGSAPPASRIALRSRMHSANAHRTNGGWMQVDAWLRALGLQE
jgi:hypothetical protein